MTTVTVSMYCRRKGWILHSVSARYSHDREAVPRLRGRFRAS